MKSKRITIKFFLQEGVAVSLDDFIPVFHRWIQEKTVEGLLIDVADYNQVQNGPGVILIGDEVDYAIDLGGGRPGLLLRYKRRGALDIPLHAQLSDALRLALRACLLLESDPDLQGRITFRTDEAEIGFPDRLHAPNTSETFAACSTEILELLEQLSPGGNPSIQIAFADPRELFTLQARIQQAPQLNVLVDNLETGRAAIRAGKSAS